jgi:hypothetical protein
MIRLLYIARYLALAALLLLLLALAPAMAQNVVYQGQTTQLGVNQDPGDTYEWELYNDSTVNFAQVNGVTSAAYADIVGANNTAVINVQWNQPGEYFFKVTAKSSCTNNLRIGRMKVLPSLPGAVLSLNPDSMCIGDPARDLVLTFSGKGPWNMTLQVEDLASGTVTTQVYPGIPESDNPKKIPVGPNAFTKYTVIEVTNIFGTQSEPSNSVILKVHPLPEKTPIYLKKP